MLAILPTFYQLEQGGKYIQYVKYGCEPAGVPVGSPREPLLPLTEEEKSKFRDIVTQLKSLNLQKLVA